MFSLKKISFFQKNNSEIFNISENNRISVEAAKVYYTKVFDRCVEATKVPCKSVIEIIWFFKINICINKKPDILEAPQN